jgi:hypothetical protein
LARTASTSAANRSRGWAASRSSRRTPRATRSSSSSQPEPRPDCLRGPDRARGAAHGRAQQCPRCPSTHRQVRTSVGEHRLRHSGAGVGHPASRAVCATTDGSVAQGSAFAERAGDAPLEPAPGGPFCSYLVRSCSAGFSRRVNGSQRTQRRFRRQRLFDPRLTHPETVLGDLGVSTDSSTSRPLTPTEARRPSGLSALVREVSRATDPLDAPRAARRVADGSRPPDRGGVEEAVSTDRGRGASSGVSAGRSTIPSSND